MKDITAKLADGIGSVDNGDFFFSQRRTLQMKAFREEIASLTESDDQWVSARVIADGRLGTAYTEKIDSRAIGRVAARALENAAFADADPGNTLFDKSETGEYDGRTGDLGSRTVDEKKKMVLAGERIAMAYDSRIVNVPYCYYSESDGTYAIVNSHGLIKSQVVSSSGMFISVMAKDGDETQTGSEFVVAAAPSDMDVELAAGTAARRAIEKLGAREIDSGEYPVVFDYQTASELLGAFIASPGSPFFGENMQKGRSMLTGKLGESIGSDLFTIVDDPTKGLNPSFFDGDGVTTNKLILVDRGVFKNIVHNVYSAAREERASTTGHASRSRGGVGTGLHHPFMENGEGAVDDLAKSMGTGILVTEIEGLHAGLNPVTGDFSLSAMGFWIEAGSRAYPVRNAVVAGNFFELASRIVSKAGDIHHDTPGGFDAPSMLVEKLSISGR